MKLSRREHARLQFVISNLRFGPTGSGRRYRGYRAAYLAAAERLGLGDREGLGKAAHLAAHSTPLPEDWEAAGVASGASE